MGAKVDNTPRFVLPRIVDTQTASQSVSMSTPQTTIYTMPKDSLVTIDCTLGSGYAPSAVDVYLNGVKIAKVAGAGMQFNDIGVSRFPDKIINAVVEEGHSLACPMILKAGDVMSIQPSGGSGTGSKTFSITIRFWE